MSNTAQLQPGNIIRGPTLPEPVEVLAVVPMGSAVKLIGRGLRTGLTHDPVLTPDQLAQLAVSSGAEPLDGDARLFRLGVEAQRLGLAYEYDPFFALSIARVDPLPHQLEAVYNYFLRLPRIRFLLADDPGAGKTIMAGLLLKELKARGLIKRTLIVTPANLTFQWQRELSDKFREKFEVVRDADASGLEPDARLTAMWLWTLGGALTPRPPSPRGRGGKDAGSAPPLPRGEGAGGRGRGRGRRSPLSPGRGAGGECRGFALEFDAARKIAQGLGIHLEKSETIVEVKGDKARLLSAGERTPYLFGKAAAPADAKPEKKKKKQVTPSLFAEYEQDDEPGAKKSGVELKPPPPGSTVLDRLHQAMILFGAQRGELLKRFLVDDGAGKDARFWKLAQSLSALYPPGTDERRWVEGVLARKKGLGL